MERILLVRFLTLAVIGYIVSSAGCGETTKVTPAHQPQSGDSPKVSASALSQQSSESINLDAALSAAVICKTVYLKETEEEAALRDIGFTKVHGFTKGSSHAVVTSTEDVVVIVFRGTQDLSDWLINADLRREKVTNGEMHRGFYEATMSMYPDLLKAAKEQGAESKAVFITGHSLGGAMALAFACEAAARNELTADSIFTFGQPLLLSRTLAEHVNASIGTRYRRFVNGSDVVSRLLPKFHHAGSRVQLTDDGFEVQPPSVAYRGADRGSEDEGDDPEAMTEPEFEELREQVQSAENQSDVDGKSKVAKGQIPWLADHSIEIYEAKIGKIQK
jgi:hypothetical protein